ncbi:Kiwa anti-phage protein KwaB-like domain-containing protein [Pseudoleptotrichia goodfellowii]|uniref:DUF4868 domain-containing protein n=1 Tax=Pseudoleptotrichia goodfellowii TaxID=157692 RepID=A0A510JA25_9FUSO|nr:Kiwa anti-phage protein KwaB-like domain-containing protein [Pseudoleptotrichia goodfellowii]BBM36179.1 hypothetical protein JCM16774_1111 [Pseudoleptotrichia goodfellowii]
MSKEILEKSLEYQGKLIKYDWNLYFVNIRKVRSDEENLYTVHKHSFKEIKELNEYIKSLTECVKKYQVKKLETVMEYNGNNPKTSCDKILLNNELIKLKWRYLLDSINNSVRTMDTKLEYQGYIIRGEHRGNVIFFGKSANPIYNFKNGKNLFKTDYDELEEITDKLCRLYFKTDFIVLNDILYVFNNNFEKFFKLEKAINKIKEEKISQILELEIFSDKEKVERLMKSNQSRNMFLTFSNERNEELRNSLKRIEIAELLKLKLDENNNFIIENREAATTLAKYLCYKIVQEKRTDNILEVSSAIKIGDKK